MRKNRFTALVLSALFFLAFEPQGKTSASGTSDNIDQLRTKGTLINDIAEFIAGVPNENNRFKNIATNADYKKYSEGINSSWNAFFPENLSKLSAWSSKVLSVHKEKTVFYPFSGPDILHPLSLFPSSEYIIMFGLEPTGNIPSLSDMQKPELMEQLRHVPSELNFILNHAFFVTMQMQKNIGKSVFNGPSGIILFFLARGGYFVKTAEYVSLDISGELVRGRSKSSKVMGIEVTFVGNDNTERKLVYFSLDISDKSVTLKPFKKWITKKTDLLTVVKSASYLMHLGNFSSIRNIIFKTSKLIVQDDSGIALRYFDKKKWSLSYYGKYHKPIPVFKSFYQRELDYNTRKYSKGPIDFSYGYGYGYKNITYHLTVAERKDQAVRK